MQNKSKNVCNTLNIPEIPTQIEFVWPELDK